MKKRILKGKKPEWAGLILFAAAYVVISAFHEPWFDEAQAWQIARCASLREMLFEIPHYEGHPPLWWLILAIPAKLGSPFELGLKAVGFLISTASASLLLFRSRLPRILRLTLPFTYFFFYQYGVVVRPYSLMLLSLLLLGMELNGWNEHPWRVALLMVLLCLTGAYGILISGGISVCILWELRKEKGVKRLLGELLRDRRTVSLLVLLALALLILLEIYPAKDAFATNIPEETPLLARLLCAFFTFPLDCFLTTNSWFNAELVSLMAAEMPAGLLLLCSVLGLVFWLYILSFSSRRGLKFLLIPYALFAAFTSAVYFSTHHLGVAFLLILFWAEFIIRDEKRLELGKAALAKIEKTQRDGKLLRGASLILLSACMLIPLYWTVAASIREVRSEYCSARSTAEFLKKTGLEAEPNIFVVWGYGGSIFPESQGNEDYINTAVIAGAVPLDAYMQRNIVSNLNGGDVKEGFVRYRSVSYEESRKTIAEWRSRGAPGVVIGYPKLSAVFGNDVSPSDYTCVYLGEYEFIWKNSAEKGKMPVYVRNELVEQYGLEVEDDWDIRLLNEGFCITEEMREAFENGVPIEEILKPYLDAMFGEED